MTTVNTNVKFVLSASSSLKVEVIFFFLAKVLVQESLERDLEGKIVEF